jgi:hypothetical protein
MIVELGKFEARVKRHRINTAESLSRPIHEDYDTARLDPVRVSQYA